MKLNLTNLKIILKRKCYRLLMIPQQWSMTFSTFYHIVKIPIFQHIKAVFEECSNQINSTNIR